MERIVVVGAGLAGLRAAEALRKQGFEGDLALVGDESHRPYNRPPLSKQVLAGEMESEKTLFRCDDLETVWTLGQPAAGLDTDRQVVELEDGEKLSYDGLILATGRRAKSFPDLPELEGFYMLRGLDDALAFSKAIEGNPRVAIIGAGFIGCEVAATLRKREVDQVTMIDLAPHPMLPLGEEIGGRAAKLHEERGVDLRLDASVEGFEGDRKVEAVLLGGDERVEADVVLLALGSAPNTEWLEGSGVELHHGNVLCDADCMARGVENVAAAGDMAAWPHPSSEGEAIWVEHWTTAGEMGRAAAANLLAGDGQRKPFVPVPTFWSDQYEVKIKSVGLLDQADELEIVEEDPDKWKLVAEGRRDGELVGAITFNANRTLIDYQRKLAEALKDDGS